MAKLYIGRIREDIERNHIGIEDIQYYRGMSVYLKPDNVHGTAYKYRGRLPKNNIGYAWGWDDSCFSEVEEIT